MYVMQSEKETIIALRVMGVFVGESPRRGVAPLNNSIICLMRMRRAWIGRDGIIP